MKLELLIALFDCKDFFERGVIMLLKCFKRATLAGIFSGGIFYVRHLIAFTASVCLDVHRGGFFFNMGNNKAEFGMGGGTTGLDESLLYTADTEYGWGDACDKKAMHGCPWIKKASVVKSFT
ncbi:hypothetical protein Tco_1463009 [Tanacetum coccineum]